jgi:hypothetical protein
MSGFYWKNLMPFSTLGFYLTSTREALIRKTPCPQLQGILLLKAKMA